MEKEWTLLDYTNQKNGGYLQLQRGGKRVCDFFPFAKDADAAWVREQAALIMETMNNSGIKYTTAGFGIDRDALV